MTLEWYGGRMELHQHRETRGKPMVTGSSTRACDLVSRVCMYAHCVKKEQKLKEKDKDSNYRNHKIVVVIENYIK